MIDPMLLFDAAIAIAILVVAIGSLAVKNQFQSIVLFIVFGLMMAIVWCRLGAVDVALAEAAIGAGLTGALLLNTLAAIGGVRRNSATTADRDPSPRQFLLPAPITAMLVLLPAAYCAWIAISLDTVDTRRIPLIDALPKAGVANSVTAVLLNMRAYDTLLEVGVLVVAAYAVIAFKPHAINKQHLPSIGPVLRSFVGFIVPLIVLVAAYLLWAGSKTPGGAFQAGALAGAAGVLLLVTGAEPPIWIQRASSTILIFGACVFLSAAIFPMIFWAHFLEYRDQLALVLILIIETALTVSIAWILVLLFAGGALHRTNPDSSAGDLRRNTEPS